MAHQDPVGPLSEFDALLRQELSVEPSTSFLPRVREQIRTEPAAAPWSLWRFAPLAAAATLVLAIGVFMWSRVNDTTPAPGPIASAPREISAPAPATPPVLEPRTPNPEPRVANHASRTAISGQRTTDNGQRVSKEPEVIVDAHQREALQALMRMINQGQLTQEAFKKTTPPPVRHRRGGHDHRRRSGLSEPDRRRRRLAG